MICSFSGSRFPGERHHGSAVGPQQKAGSDQPADPPQRSNLVRISSLLFLTLVFPVVVLHFSTSFIFPHQFCLLLCGCGLVHGAGVRAVHPADLHVRERHGVHHGGGALPCRREGAGHRKRVCCSQEESRVKITALRQKPDFNLVMSSAV